MLKHHRCEYTTRDGEFYELDGEVMYADGRVSVTYLFIYFRGRTNITHDFSERERARFDHIFADSFMRLNAEDVA